MFRRQYAKPRKYIYIEKNKNHAHRLKNTTIAGNRVWVRWNDFLFLPGIQ